MLCNAGDVHKFISVHRGPNEVSLGEKVFTCVLQHHHRLLVTLEGVVERKLTTCHVKPLGCVFIQLLQPNLKG